MTTHPDGDERRNVEHDDDDDDCDRREVTLHRILRRSIRIANGDELGIDDLPESIEGADLWPTLRRLGAT